MSKCSCGRLGCTCTNPECASGWVQAKPDDPMDTSVKRCRVCDPTWRPHDERVELAEQAAIREAEGKERAKAAAVQLDAERQASMFGGKASDERSPWPELGRDGG